MALVSGATLLLTENFLRRKVESVKRSFLHSFPGKSKCGRIALFTGIITPALGILATILIDWNRRDVFGDSVVSRLAQIIFLASFGVAAVCFALFLWFEFLAYRHSSRSEKSASGDSN